MVVSSIAGERKFRHEALPYTDAGQFLPTAVSAVREGLEADERVVVLASATKLSGLQDALGSDAGEVTCIASDRHARNPARVAMILENFRGGGGDDRLSRGVSDSAPGRSTAATLEASFADCVLNLVALRSWALSLMCLFDTSALDDAARLSIRQGHGVVRGSQTNEDFEPDLGLALYAAMPDPAPASASRAVVVAGGLSHARSFVRAAVSGYRLATDRVDDLVLAVNEIVTNSLRHGGGTAHLAVWSQDGAAVCEVRDRGFIDNPLTGRFAPSTSSASGRGVWMANNLCDLVQLRSSSAGTVVRLHVDS